MDIIKWRIIYLLGCVGSRCGIIIYIINGIEPMDLYFTGVFYIFVASKFVFLDFLQRPNIESVSLRFVHAIIYLIFAFYAMRGYTDYAWKILVVDLVIGTSLYVLSNMKPTCNKAFSNIVNSYTEAVILDV